MLQNNRFIQKIHNLYYVNARQQKNNYLSLQIPLKHYCILIFLLSLILCFNLIHKYTIFLELQQGRSFEVTIINHYSKKPKSEKFKLQDSNGNIFYATYRGVFKNLIGKKAHVYGKIYRCSFLQFLKSCNIYNSSLSLIPVTSTKRAFVEFVRKQHTSTLGANLYNALFFAEQLDYSLRQSSMALGLAHLIAISGFHLASLTLLFYACICPFYFLIHRYLCYRNAFYDLGLLGLIFAFCYLCLIDFEPSFLRAFIMACVAYFILFSGLKIFSFMNLFLCVFFAIALNPSLLFHIGFTLSVSGVFCIFLFMRHIGDSLMLRNRFQRIIIGILLFNCIIFLQMMPIVHYFFPYFSPYQLVSIPLSILFFLLFPLLIIAHVLQYGSLFDSVIENVVAHHFFLSEISTPLWLLIPYIFIGFLAIRYRLAYMLTIIISVIFYCANLKNFLESIQ